jgi:hypothetical protein
VVSGQWFVLLTHAAAEKLPGMWRQKDDRRRPVVRRAGSLKLCARIFAGRATLTII